jgi:hypothetical protein
MRKITNDAKNMIPPGISSHGVCHVLAAIDATMDPIARIISATNILPSLCVVVVLFYYYTTAKDLANLA